MYTYSLTLGCINVRVHKLATTKVYYAYSLTYDMSSDAFSIIDILASRFKVPVV